MRLRLLSAEGAPLSEQAQQVRVPVQLGPFEQRRLQAVMEIDSDLSVGQSAAVEMQLVDVGQGTKLVGSLGVVLLRP